MEAILQLVMEGFGVCDSVLDVCRQHFQELVRRGDLTQDQLDEVLGKVRVSLLERRRTLLDGARRECVRLLEGVPVVTEESFRILEARVRNLEEGPRDA